MKINTQFFGICVFFALVRNGVGQNQISVNPEGGSFSDSVTVTLKSNAPGAQIYYVVNKLLPYKFVSNEMFIDTENCIKYISPIVIKVSCYIVAGAVKDGKLVGAYSVATFTKNSMGAYFFRPEKKLDWRKPSKQYSILGRQIDWLYGNQNFNNAYDASVIRDNSFATSNKIGS
jgi:hypothetical protein